MLAAERRRDMTLTVTRPTTSRRPAGVVTTIALLFFLGVTAVGGGVSMIFGIGEDLVVPPAEWLDDIPLIESWVFPGLVLVIGFGLGSLFTGFGMLRRTSWAWARFAERPTGLHWSWIAALLLGIGQVVWIVLELAYLPEPSWLNAIYGVVGLAMILLALMPSTRSHLQVE
jgi:hypothetical protein